MRKVCEWIIFIWVCVMVACGVVASTCGMFALVRFAIKGAIG